MSEFIDVVSPKANEDLNKLNNKLLEIIRNVATINTSMAGISLPSQNDAEVRRLNTELHNQATIISNLQTQLTRLSQTRQQGNQRTAEEIVNARAIRQENERQARATSNLVGAYANLNARQQQAQRSLRDYIATGQRADQSNREYARGLQRLQNEFDGLNRRLLMADRAVGAWGRTNQRVISGFSTFKNLIGAFGIGMGISLFADFGKAVFETSKRLESVNNALKLVTETSDNFIDKQEFLRRLAKDYGVQLSVLTQQFTQFYVSAKDKLSGKEIESIFESITKAGATMGLSQETMQRAFTATNQIMAKGSVQAEELKGQLSEALPGALGIMAKSLGVTEKKLMDMMKAGEVSSKAMVGFAKQLEKTYGIENVKNVESLASATERYKTAFEDMVTVIASKESVLGKFFKGLVDMGTKSLDNLTALAIKASDLYSMAFDTDAEKAEKKKQKQIASGVALAKTFTDVFTNEQSKVEFSLSKIRELMNEKDELYTNAKKLEDDNRRLLESTSPDIKDAKSGELRRYWQDVFDNNNKQIKEYNDKINKTIGLIQGYKKATKKEDVIAPFSDTEVDEKALQDRLKREEEARRQAFINRKKQLELELQTIAETMNDETKLETVRLEALELYRLKKEEIISLMYREDLRLAKDNYLKQEEALLDYHKSTLDSITEWVKLVEGIQKDQIKPIEIKTVGDAGKTLAEGAKLATDALEKQNDALKVTEESLKAIQKQIDDYLKTFQEGFFADAGLPTLFKVLNNEILGFGENFAVTFNAIGEIAQEAFAFISEASNRNFQNEYENLARQKEISLLFAGESASAREEIERQYDVRQREIKRRQAQAEKRQALFNIAIDTAQGVVSALASTPPNIPLSIAIGVIGAVQAGVVAGQQIPQYFKGTDNHKGGLMMINDASGSNYKEIVQTPDGKMRMYNERNKVVDAPKGTKVFDADKSLDMLLFDRDLNNILLSNNIGNAPKIEVNNSAMSDAQVDRLVKTIEGKTEYMPNYDEYGFRLFVRNGHTTREVKNRRINGKGTSV